MNEDPRFDETFFCVEANSNESLEIWKELHQKRKIPWTQGDGIIVQIGYIKNDPTMPVTITLQWDTVRGKLVCFYDATSRFVDHVMVEEWLKKYIVKNKKWGGGRTIITDTMNWHHMWHAIEEAQTLWMQIGEEFKSFPNLAALGASYQKDAVVFYGPKDNPKKESDLPAKELQYVQLWRLVHG